MAHESTVYGYILESGDDHEENLLAISRFPFDELYPFTDIFWSGSRAAYWHRVISFAGNYRQIEPDWNEWMWKFGRLLSVLEASEAAVNLHGYLGSFEWRLRPSSWQRYLTRDIERLPGSFKGEEWGIYQSPTLDFSFDPTLCKFEDGRWYVPRWDSAHPR